MFESDCVTIMPQNLTQNLTYKSFYKFKVSLRKNDPAWTTVFV